MGDYTTDSGAKAAGELHSRLTSVWEWIALAAVVVLLVTGQLAIGRAKRMGWTTYTEGARLTGGCARTSPRSCRDQLAIEDGGSRRAGTGACLRGYSIAPRSGLGQVFGRARVTGENSCRDKAQSVVSLRQGGAL